jgi:tetratricopeptide (TPR) repeat protein
MLSETKSVNLSLSCSPVKERELMDTQQSNDSLSAATNFLNIGFSYRKAEDFVNAIKFYTKALDCNPNYFNALFNRAFAYDKIGDTSSAIANYEKALESNPSNPFTYYNLGIIYDKMEKHHQAIKYFTQAISISSEKSDFYHNRGLSLRKICNFKEAIKDFNEALAITPKHTKALYNKAYCYEKMQLYHEAEENYKQCIELQANNLNAYYHLARLQEKLGGPKLISALQNYTIAISIESTFAPLYNGRGLVYDKLKQFSNAIKDFTSAILHDPSNSVYWHNRACCYKNNKEYIHKQ